MTDSPMPSPEPEPEVPAPHGAEATSPARRRFLGAVSAVGAATIGGLVGVPVLRALVSPGFDRAAPAAWIKVADDINTLDLGVPIKVDFVEVVNDVWVESRLLRSVWLYTDDAKTFTAFSGVCPHLGCSFFFEADKKVFHCPCHHGLFDGKTGAVLGGPPPRGLDTLDVRVDADALYVKHRLFRPGIPTKEVLA